MSNTIQKFYEIRICDLCGGEVKENTRMEHSYCIECGMVESGDKTKYMCSLCESICDDEECRCYEQQ